MKNCRACSGTNMQEVMHLENVPKDVQRLLSKDNLDSVSRYTNDMRVFQCADCGLVQSPVNLSNDYYDDYLMTTSFSKKLQDYLDGLVSQFLEEYGPKVRKVIDVGCGDGAFMHPFHKRKIKVEGIEPSEKSRLACKQNGYKVYPGYMTADTRLAGAPYDGFVSRQVLEHVSDISGFFQGLRNNLSSGAVGIIEVPRLEKSLQDARFYDFFPDHVNYFTLESLRTVIELNGFTVLGMGAVMDDEYNVAIVQVRSGHDFKQVKKQKSLLTAELEKLLRAKKKSGTAIWGAGAKGISILSDMDTKNLGAVVDSDENKIGRYIPGKNILISAPQDLIDKKIGTVVISAIAYQNAILEKLKELDYQGEIYLITAQGLQLYKE